MPNSASRSARRWTSTLVVLAISAVLLDAWQHTRSAEDRKATRDHLNGVISALAVREDDAGKARSLELEVATAERHRLADNFARLAKRVAGLEGRLDTADAERRRLKGEVDVLKGMVSGMSSPGVEHE